MDHINIITSFLAGVLMFLAPCTLPLVPGFIAFISQGERGKAMRRAFEFCLGFLLAFLVFGLLAGLFGAALAPYKYVLQKLGAVLVIVFGLYLLGVFRWNFSGFSLSEKFRKFYQGKHGAFFFGLAFALGWTPCVGPVLAGIFFYATFSFSVLKALWLFVFFSLGFVLPFLFVAYLVQRGRNVRLRSARIFTILAGLLLIFLGILLFAGRFGIIIGWFYKVFSFFDYQNITNLL